MSELFTHEEHETQLIHLGVVSAMLHEFRSSSDKDEVDSAIESLAVNYRKALDANRWRLLTDQPQQDQRIEIAHIAEFGDRLDSTITVYGSIHYEMLMLELGERSLVWRYAPLPSDEEIRDLMEMGK